MSHTTRFLSLMLFCHAAGFQFCLYAVAQERSGLSRVPAEAVWMAASAALRGMAPETGIEQVSCQMAAGSEAGADHKFRGGQATTVRLS